MSYSIEALSLPVQQHIDSILFWKQETFLKVLTADQSKSNSLYTSAMVPAQFNVNVLIICNKIMKRCSPILPLSLPLSWTNLRNGSLIIVLYITIQPSTVYVVEVSSLVYFIKWITELTQFLLRKLCINVKETSLRFLLFLLAVSIRKILDFSNINNNYRN